MGKYCEGGMRQGTRATGNNCNKVKKGEKRAQRVLEIRGRKGEGGDEGEIQGE